MSKNFENHRGESYCSDVSTGQYGNYPVENQTINFKSLLPSLKVGKIVVSAGAVVTVSGRQDSQESKKYNKGLLPDWAGVKLGEGEHWVNLIDVSIDATGATNSCIVYWA